MKKYVILLLMSLCYVSIARGQEEDKIVPIGILPVTSLPNSGVQFTEHVREQITSAFTSKSRFIVVDRTRLDAIYKERNLQMREDFMDGAIVEQGKSIGARYLVNGSISELNFNNVNTKKTSYPVDKVTGKVYIREWIRLDLQVVLVVNVKIIDVETGAVKSTKTVTSSLVFEGNESARPNPSEQMVIQNINNLRGYIKAWINSVFPVEMKVVQIESSDKKGIPKTILVTGGSEMDMQHSKSLIINTSSELEVFESRIITLDGREIQRPLVVGNVVVEKVEGELAVCKIKNGHEEILQSMNAGKQLFLRIKSY